MRLRLGAVCVLAAGTAAADVVTDGTVGPRGGLAGPDFEIGADLGRRAGGNLFHSFERFSLAAGERATFSGPDQIRNVISRVTGGARSDIDGTIHSTIPGADFYFINPAGVAFGPNALLNVPGSFHIATADELRFADGARFSAGDPAASSFTVAAPEAFGFLGPAPAPVLVRESGLLVRPGAALSLVGGAVEVTGGLTGIIQAPAGRVTLAALAAPGEIRIADGVSTATGGRVRLRDLALVQVSGDGSGSVVIRAGEFVLAEESFILADNLGPTDARAGVDVAVERAEIGDGSAIVAEVLGSGAGADVAVRADAAIVLSEGGFLSSRSLSAGAPGGVTVDAPEVHLAGSVTRRPTGIATDPLDPTTTANAGPVAIRAARSLVIENGSQVSTRTAVNEGGPITIEARRVVIADAIVTSSVRGDAQSAGTIRITAEQMVIRDGAVVASDSSGFGQGGLIVLRAGAGGLTLEGGFVTASAAGAGGGGTIDLASADEVLIRDGAILSVALGPGDAGDVRVRADRLALRDGSIASQSLVSGGGRITVLVDQLIDLENGEMITSVFGGAGTTAGDITIDPRFIILDGGRIVAQATAGRGGNIRIAADNLILSPDGVIDASAEQGIDGTVVVSSPEVDLAAGLVVIDSSLVDVAQLRERCAARRDIGASSFTGVGRGGLPPTPDGPLAGAYSTEFGAPRFARAALRGDGEASAEARSLERAIWPAIGGLAPCHGAL
jgi:filamentous hemagglutinin family protein